MRLPHFEEDKLHVALRIASEIYQRHESGVPYSGLLRDLSHLVGSELDGTDVCAAIGSMASDDWARILLLDPQTVPLEIGRHDLIEMVELLSTPDTPEWLVHWCRRCVEQATGCHDVLGLLDDPKGLSSEELLDEAFKRKRRILLTPPPRQN